MAIAARGVSKISTRIQETTERAFRPLQLQSSAEVACIISFWKCRQHVRGGMDIVPDDIRARYGLAEDEISG
jgi:hypothetical protein